jgi:hypothetical protein
VDLDQSGELEDMTPGLDPIIVHAIQLAVAPVFLMAGIAGLLGVMANRLA